MCSYGRPLTEKSCHRRVARQIRILRSLCRVRQVLIATQDTETQPRFCPCASHKKKSNHARALSRVTLEDGSRRSTATGMSRNMSSRPGLSPGTSSTTRGVYVQSTHPSDCLSYPMSFRSIFISRSIVSMVKNCHVN